MNLIGCYILIKVTYRKARKFANTLCFVDGLCAINDNSEFGKSFQEIYTSELVLKKENKPNLNASYLDLNINVKCRKFETEFYDKRSISL